MHNSYCNFSWVAAPQPHFSETEHFCQLPAGEPHEWHRCSCGLMAKNQTGAPRSVDLTSSTELAA